MKKNFNSVALQDLQDSFKDLQEIYNLIISISGKKAATRILLDAALFECGCISQFTQDLGGSGFSSIDDTADFIYTMTKNA